MLMDDRGSLTQFADYSLGTLRVSPTRRLIEGNNSVVPLEPLVMQLLVELSRNAGRVVSRRQIFERCWGGAPMGDDSLNRLVAVLRRSLDAAAEGLVSVETVPRTGYALRIHRLVPDRNEAGDGARELQRAIDEGLASIRLGLPEPDNLRIELLRHAAGQRPGHAPAWGMLALLYRYAAEYSEQPGCSDYVANCQESAAKALALDPREPTALVALATVAPLFGRWLDARKRLGAIAQDNQNSFVALHELAIMEMATGRVRAAKTLIDGLRETDPLATCLCYKSIYQNWSTGEHAQMDHVADQAIQLWPWHPAVWAARFWTLAYTGRAHAASQMLDDANRPHIPPPALRLFQIVAVALASGDSAALERAAATSEEMARSGPGRAIAALFALGLLDRPDVQLDIAAAYYCRAGQHPVPVHRTDGEPSINDQHRRVTQILFTPAFAAARQHPGFIALCDRMGLTTYWQTTGMQPDFLNAAGPA